MNAFIENIQKNIRVLAYCLRHKDTPLLAKLLIVLLLAYLLSPIDLIPDFIPVIGLLDELLILPVGMYVVLKLIPNELVQSAESVEIIHEKWLKVLGLIIIVIVWGLVIAYLWNMFK